MSRLKFCAFILLVFFAPGSKSNEYVGKFSPTVASGHNKGVDRDTPIDGPEDGVDNVSDVNVLPPVVEDDGGVGQDTESNDGVSYPIDATDKLVPIPNEPEGGLNEFIPECAPCGPEPTCKVPNPGPVICTQVCLKPIRAYCKDGFVRNSEGNCVSVDDCPAVPTTCPENEEVPTCAPCGHEKTCSDALDPNYFAPQCFACTATTDCYCSPGYVRNDDGKCVPEKKCEKSDVGPNETIPACVPCNEEPTCEVPHPLLRPCSKICNMNTRAYCKKGFLRNSEGSCVSPDDCPTNPGEISICQCIRGFVCMDDGKCVPDNTPPPTCPENEEVPTCAPCGHEKTCTDALDPNYFAPQCFACTATTDCYCSPGYVRNDDGKCVPEKKCSPSDKCALVRCMTGTHCVNGNCLPDQAECDKNEVSLICFPCPPEKTCTDVLNPDYRPVCKMMPCRPKDTCYCSPGFARNDDGKCVSEKKCEKPDEPECGPNEQVPICVPCGPEPTCKVPSPKPMICPAVCRFNDKCYCEEGYYRNKRGMCVTLRQCNRRPKPCRMFCPFWMICKNNKCIPRSSCSSILCKPGFFCMKGKCIRGKPPVGKCATVRCAAGFRCVNGVCHSDYE